MPKFISSLKFRLVPVLAAGLMFLAAANAWANECDNLEAHDEWNGMMQELLRHLMEQNYDEALEDAKVLFPICKDSPALNYYTGLAFRGKGEENRALQYFQIASVNTSQFEVDKNLSRRIWYTLYESEHPERTKEAIDKHLELEEAQAKEIEKLKLELMDSDKVLIHEKDKEYLAYERMMWVGAGIGLGGIALTFAGSIMVVLAGRNPVERDSTETKLHYNLVPLYPAGYSILGIGLGATVAGAIVTGISGYKYIQLRPESETDTASDLSVAFGPSNLNVLITF
ncbi:MAG: hypothetical protein IKY83_00855 [Proteobacteria bacterium]|nr:hypothetical protein [Pseudomonadota bacterium]